MVSGDHRPINYHILNIIEEVHTHMTYIGQHVTIKYDDPQQITR